VLRPSAVDNRSRKNKKNVVYRIEPQSHRAHGGRTNGDDYCQEANMLFISSRKVNWTCNLIKDYIVSSLFCMGELESEKIYVSVPRW
jgi:hypothetical protein